MNYFLKNTSQEIVVPNDDEYIALVKDILDNKSFLSMQNYIQHGNTSCLSHSINVSYLSYKWCKKMGLNAKSAARAGLLHDLFLYDWHLRPREKGELLHGFEHPKKALENAQREFELTKMERNIILRHMWPLTLTPPAYKEAYAVVYYDKYCSLLESFYLPALQTDCIAYQPI